MSVTTLSSWYCFIVSLPLDILGKGIDTYSLMLQACYSPNMEKVDPLLKEGNKYTQRQACPALRQKYLEEGIILSFLIGYAGVCWTM